MTYDPSRVGRPYAPFGTYDYGENPQAAGANIGVIRLLESAPSVGRDVIFKMTLALETPDMWTPPLVIM